MSLDYETIRYALNKAKEMNLKKVRIESEGVCFRASLFKEQESIPEQNFPEEISEKSIHHPHPLIEITSTYVGYYQPVEGIKIGVHVNKGQVVARIMALGLSNDILAEADGEVVSLELKENDPVEFGKSILIMKPILSS